MAFESKKLGIFIRQTNVRNIDGKLTDLQGINIQKKFMPSVANLTDLDLTKYKIVNKNQFAYNPMHVGRDRVLPISLLRDRDELIVSPAYVVFEIIDINELHPDYLMMWFNRPEFDRRAWFTTDNSVRGGFSWAALCGMDIPYVSPDKQAEIIEEYNGIMDRIRLNEKMNAELHKIAHLLRSFSFGATI